MTGLPAAIRFVLVVLGALLLGSAVRQWLRLRSAGTDATPSPPLSGRALLTACAVARRLPVLSRRSDPVVLATRLALAPDCLAARWIAHGLAAWQRRAAASAADPGPPPPLGTLAAGVRLLCGLLALALPLATLGFLIAGGTAAAVLGLAGFAAGAVLPDAVLSMAACRGTGAGMSGAAAAVDLLAATASAGLSLPEAMVLTAGHAPPAVAAVLRAAAVRRAMGEDPGRALHAEAIRFGVPLLGDVAQAVERQRRLGVPLGPELAGIATRLRSEQRARALQRAARRAPLGTLVVALVVAPTCVAAVIACVIGGVLQSGTLGLH
jgi:hypothetical protein